MHILMVGDIQGLYEKHIHSFGHEVTVCLTAETALEAYQHIFYPLIILDLELLGPDGMEFCRHIRSLPQGDHSMILTIIGHDKTKDLRAILDAGADDYLTKPDSIDVLHIRINILERQIWNHIQRKQMEEELRTYREHLEALIKERTAELQQVNTSLRQQIAEPMLYEQFVDQKSLRLYEVLEALEKRLITKALEHHHWHRGKTAATLGIPRRSLHRKMKKFDLIDS